MADLEEFLEENPIKLNLFLAGINVGEVGSMRLRKHIESCPRLQILELRGSSIGHQGCLNLAHGLKNHPSINHIGLSRNGIDSGAIVRLLAAIKLSPVQSLDLEWNSLDDSVAIALAANLEEEDCSLMAVTLERNNIRADGATALAKALQTNTSLQNLNLGFNRVGSYGAMRLGEMMRVNRTLLTLNVSNNDIPLDGARVMVEGLAVNQVLRALNVQGNQFLPAFAEQSRNMSFSPNLKELNLFGNKMSTLSATGFGECLHNAQHIIGLSLGKTFAGDACFSPVLNGITFMASLGLLDISSGSLTSDSGNGICNVLSTCTNLHTLFVDDNRLEPAGMKPIAQGLVHAASLTCLSMSNCRIRSDGMDLISEALSRRSGLPLTSLSLANNNIDTDATIGLCEALIADTRSCEMTNLDLSQNHISGRACAGFVKLFGRHRKLLSINIRENIISDLLHMSFLTVDAAQFYLEDKANQKRDSEEARSASRGAATHGAADSTFSVDRSLSPQNLYSNFNGTGEAWREASPVHHRESTMDRKEMMMRLSESPLRAESRQGARLVSAAMASPIGKSNDTTIVSASPMSALRSQRREPAADVLPGLAGEASPIKPSQRRIQLHDVEGNISELCISDTQLRVKFAACDAEGKGYLTKEEFMDAYKKMEVVQLDSDKKRLQDMVQKYAKDGRVTFKEFSIMMLSLVKT